jgi:hypothetical protein
MYSLKGPVATREREDASHRPDNVCIPEASHPNAGEARCHPAVGPQKGNESIRQADYGTYPPGDYHRKLHDV